MSLLRSSRVALVGAVSFGIMIGAMGTGLAVGLLGSSRFTDVPAGSYYDSAIGEMVQEGIIRGFEDGTFKPDEPATRGQIAVLLKRLRDDLLREGVAVSSSAAASSSSAMSETASSAAAISSAASSAVTSYAYNPAGYLRFTTSNFSINESLGSVIATIVRTGGNQGTVTVEYALKPGTAVAGTDYVDSSGVLTFANKETSKKLTIQVKDDGITKDNRTFTIELKNPGNGVGISTPSAATVTITDKYAVSSSSLPQGTSAAASSVASSPILSFSAAAYGIIENAGSMTVGVVRSGVTTGAVDVGYSTTNGTAGSTDFSATSGTVSFAAGETTKTFTLTIPDDTSIDGNKTVTLSLTSPTAGGVIANPGAVVLTIYDNETAAYGSGSMKFSKANYEAGESSGKAVITVMRVGGTKGAASVNYAANGGSATNGVDYVGVAGTLSFAVGESSKTFDVPLMKDTSADAGETILLNLSNPVGTILGDPIIASILMSD
ncbi:S-layer homology domain-containing protein [Candidatus Peregrinibacteria bacterium]|nr:S-layer homology domain-containing protein [Candidatus Peregrinibacteria bacterium]